jgi:hypothetical protein
MAQEAALKDLLLVQGANNGKKKYGDLQLIDC